VASFTCCRPHIAGFARESKGKMKKAAAAKANRPTTFATTSVLVFTRETVFIIESSFLLIGKVFAYGFFCR
jgi:hypothetical protein